MKSEIRSCLSARFRTGWTIRSLRGVALMLVSLTMLSGAVSSAQAATCLITSVADNGPGTLRDAIVNQSCDTINFAVTGAITLTSGPLIVGRNIAMIGPGARVLMVQRDSTLSYVFPVFKFATSQISTISGLTISNGKRYVENGGGIENRGTLTVTDVILSNNWASSGGGFANYGTMTVSNTIVTQNRSSAAVSNDGTLTMNYSSIIDNLCEYVGAIDNGGTVFLNNSTLAGNYGAEEGGGIRNFANITITNSTIYNNSVATNGGALSNYGIATIRNSTIYKNSATFGQIDNHATVYLYNSIVTGGVGTDLPYMDLRGNMPVGEYNIVGGLSGGSLFGTNLVGVNPLLGPLQNNGGPTLTLALLDGSPAINAGDPYFSDPNVPFDQRGAGFARVIGGRIDIGATEYIQPYPFSGFLQPVDNLPTINAVKAGSAIPVKFSLGGNRGLNILATGSPSVQPIACDTSAPLSDIEVTVAAGASSLSYDVTTATYTYVWKTNTAWKNTCVQLTVKLNDNTTHVANFQLK